MENSKRLNNRDKRRTDILRSAETIIRQGQSAFSIRALATQSGNTPRTIYAIFNSKSGIIFSLLTAFVEDWIAAYPALSKSKSAFENAVEQLLSVLHRLTIDTEYGQRLLKLSYQEQFGEERLQIEHWIYSLILDRLQQLKELGVLGDSTPTKEIAYTTTCTTIYTLERWAYGKYDSDYLVTAVEFAIRNSCRPHLLNPCVE